MITITVHQHIEQNQPQAAPRSKKKVAPFADHQRQPLASSQDDNQPAARKSSLHSKSISLVINPNFWPAEPSDWPGPKPTARRSRASRRNLLSWASSSDCSLFSSCPSVASLVQTEPQPQQQQSVEIQPEGQPEGAQPLEIFRQAGAVLRHISDQFTQSRRRTI